VGRSGLEHPAGRERQHVGAAVVPEVAPVERADLAVGGEQQGHARPVLIDGPAQAAKKPCAARGLRRGAAGAGYDLDRTGVAAAGVSSCVGLDRNGRSSIASKSNPG